MGFNIFSYISSILMCNNTPCNTQKLEGYDKDLAYTFIFANDKESFLSTETYYFIKVWNSYSCFSDLGKISELIKKKGLTNIITEKMPEGIPAGEAGMRLLSNNEIRSLKDCLEGK